MDVPDLTVPYFGRTAWSKVLGGSLNVGFQLAVLICANPVDIGSTGWDLS